MANGGTSTSLSNKILDAVDILTRSEVAAAGFDKTIVGTIVNLDDEATGRYKVKYQDAQFYAYSSDLSVTFNRGASVQIKIPNNDFSGKKIIIGTAEEGSLNYGIMVTDPMSYYDPIGANLISSGKAFGLSTYWDNDDNEETHSYSTIIYDVDMGIDEIDFDRDRMNMLFTDADSILLGATFKTNIPQEERFNGNYGIRFIFAYTGKDQTTSIFRSYTVDIDKMTGIPYAYSNETQQIIPFDFIKQNLVGLYRIELFAEDFPTTNNEAEENIFISNLFLQLGTRKNDAELAENSLSISQPQGEHFATGLANSKTAIANLRIDGKLVESKQNIRNTIVNYYWFIEDITVTRSSSEGYFNKGGRGWRCLNNYTISQEATEDSAEKRTYIPETNNIFTVNKDDLTMYKTNYKCVAVYDNKITVDATFSFLQDDLKDREVKITANPAITVFRDGQGKVTLTCESTAAAASYQWIKIDNEGNYSLLTDTDTVNNLLERAIETRDNLITAINNGTKPNTPQNQELIKVSQQQIDNIENSRTRRKDNIIYNLFAKDIIGTEVYKCAAYNYANQILGIGEIAVTNNLSSGENTFNGNVTIQNGQQIFKYNAAGVAPISEQFEQPLQIEPLTFTFVDQMGVLITPDDIGYGNIRWRVPYEDTLIIPVGTVVSRDEVNKIAVYNGENFSYTISDKYYSNHDRNTIELEIYYNGKSYYATTNFYFVKDGNNGTNGTEYVARLIPQNTIGRLPIIAPNEETYIELELWHNGILVYTGHSSSGISDEGKPVKITWDTIRQKGSKSNITISNGTIHAKSSYDINGIDIVQAKVNYDNKDIIVTLPVIIGESLDNSYKLNLKNGTGYTQVLYNNNGINPVYDNSTPFAITVQQKDGDTNYYGEINNNPNLKYYWSLSEDLQFAEGSLATDSTISVVPAAQYNDKILNHRVNCRVKINDDTIGILHIPIYFLIDQYSHPALNEWDGNSIKLDADGNTMLLSPQAGFGKKESDNSYTGLYLGQIKSLDENGNFISQETGLEARYHGERTIFLDAETGKATFGKAGSARIVLDPTNDEAIIQSGDYDLSRGTGMQINLTEPSIHYGNGNFDVDYEGNLSASNVNLSGRIVANEGGELAGWIIDSEKLYKDNGTSHVEIKSQPSKKTDGSDNLESYVIDVQYGNPKARIFGVQYTGKVIMKSAQIGGGKNDIIIGQSTDATPVAAIYYNAKSQISTNVDGFYIGTNGFGLGKHENYKSLTNTSGDDYHSKFEVLSNGTLYASNTYLLGDIHAKAGYIGTGNSIWTIAGKSIYNSKSALNNNNNGVYLGTDGIGLGSLNDYSNVPGVADSDKTHSKFEVSSSGKLYAKDGIFDGHIYSTSGKIGGWTISSNELKGVSQSDGTYITINSNGSIQHSSGNWDLAKNGTATFKKVRITTDGDSYSANTTVINANNKFTVKGDGSVKATAADITGKITANEGSIGGWNLTENGLWKGGSAASPTVYLGSNNLAMKVAGHDLTNIRFKAGENFAVTSTGKLYATEANLSGTINATSGSFTGTINANKGTIGGWTIEKTLLSGGNVKLNSSGSIEGKNWSITNAGYATFSNIRITSSNYSGSNNLIDYGDNFKVTSGGSLTARNANFSGAITGSTYTAGSINISKNGYYLKMGYGTDHPEVSGLNVTSKGGIAMNGKGGISGCTSLGNSGAVFTFSGTNINTKANMKIEGTLTCNNPIHGYGFANNCDSEDLWIQVGDTSTTGGGWKCLKIRHGLIYAVQ